MIEKGENHILLPHDCTPAFIRPILTDYSHNINNSYRMSHTIKYPKMVTLDYYYIIIIDKVHGSYFISK